jgi:hypothetical protein
MVTWRMVYTILELFAWSKAISIRYTPTLGTVCVRTVEGVYSYLSSLANARCSQYVYLTFSSLPLSPPPHSTPVLIL